MALPDEREVVALATDRRRGTRNARARRSSRRSFTAVFAPTGTDSAPAGRRRRGQARLGRAPAGVARRDHARWRDDPGRAEHACRRARPSRGAHERGDGTLLSGRERRQDEHRAAIRTHVRHGIRLPPVAAVGGRSARVMATWRGCASCISSLAPSDAAPRSSHSSSHGNSTRSATTIVSSRSFPPSTDRSNPTCRRSCDDRTSGCVASGSLRRALRRELERRPVDVVLAHGGRPFADRGPGARPCRSRSSCGNASCPSRRRCGGRRGAAWWRRLARCRRRRGRPHRRSRSRAAPARFPRPDLDDPELPRPRRRSPVSTGRRRPPRCAPRSASPPTYGVIGLVGHLIEQKRPERALDVLAGVHARGRARASRRRGRRTAAGAASIGTSPPGASAPSCTCSANVAMSAWCSAGSICSSRRARPRAYPVSSSRR